MTNVTSVEMTRPWYNAQCTICCINIDTLYGVHAAQLTMYTVYSERDFAHLFCQTYPWIKNEFGLDFYK